MILDPQLPRSTKLTHVHRCTVCGANVPKHSLNEPETRLGLYECPHCGAKGPLNIEIVEESSIEDPPEAHPEASTR